MHEIKMKYKLYAYFTRKKFYHLNMYSKMCSNKFISNVDKGPFFIIELLSLKVKSSMHIILASYNWFTLRDHLKNTREMKCGY